MPRYNNAITKSKIQILSEQADQKKYFFDSIKELLEKYTIGDNIFVGDAFGDALEASTGYFGEVACYESLEEASNHFDPTHQGLRIKENTYRVGNMYKSLSEAHEETIIDCAKRQVI